VLHVHQYIKGRCALPHVLIRGYSATCSLESGSDAPPALFDDPWLVTSELVSHELRHQNLDVIEVNNLFKRREQRFIDGLRQVQPDTRVEHNRYRHRTIAPSHAVTLSSHVRRAALYQSSAAFADMRDPVEAFAQEA
jgi:hypothetical protein